MNWFKKRNEKEVAEEVREDLIGKYRVISVDESSEVHYVLINYHYYDKEVKMHTDNFYITKGEYFSKSEEELVNFVRDLIEKEVIKSVRISSREKLLEKIVGKVEPE